MRRTVAMLMLIAGLVAGPSAAQDPPPAPPGEGPINAAQIQRWFEAYTVMQAQDALQLSEAQYGRFVTRLKALQNVRRRHAVARNRMMGDLHRLTNPQNGPAEETLLAERLKALRDEEDRAAVEIRKATEGV